MKDVFDFNSENKRDKFENKSQEELLESIKLQYLIGIATLLNDFPTNIQFLIEQRDNNPAMANVASDKLLSMLFTSTKDPKILSIPDLNVDKIIEAMNNATI